MAAEVNADDILDGGIYERISQVEEGFEDLLEVLDKVIAKGKVHSQIITNANSTRTLSNEVKKLKDEQKSLVDSQSKLIERHKKAAEASKNQAESLDILSEHTGGAINRLKDMGKQMFALAKSPLILALVALVAVVAALTSSVKTFFDATGEGEDMLEEQSAVWNQFFSTIKAGWAELGKSILGDMNDAASKNIINILFETAKVAFPFITSWINNMQKEFNKTADEALNLARILDKINDDIATNIIKSAQTETQSNKLLLESQDKIKYSDQERLNLLQQSLDLKEQQLNIDKAIAKRQYDALLLQTGLSHNLNEVQTRALSEQARLAIFTGEENKKLAESYAHIIQLEGNFYAEVKKNTGKIVALREEIRKESVKKEMDGVAERVAIAEAAMNKVIGKIQQEVIDGIRIREDGDKEILRLKKQFADDLIQAEITALEKVLQLSILNAEERAAVEKKLVKLKVDLQTALYDQVSQLDEVTVESGKTTVEKLRAIYEPFTSSLNSLFSSFTDNRIQDINRQEQALSKSLTRQMYLAGDNEKYKDDIRQLYAKRQEELDKKRLAAIRRQAIFDKAVAATQAAINTAVAVTKAGIITPLGIATAIAGGLEVAAILAKNIPSYEKGGRTTSPIVIAGEAGVEKYRTPGGKVGYTPGEATLMRLPVGTEITTHEETVRQLALDSLRATNKKDRPAAKKAVVKSNQMATVDLVRSGSIIYEAKRSNETFVKYVRSISMGRWL